MSTTFWLHLLQPLVLFVILYLTSIVSGFNGRCPAGWTYYEDHCYRLERTPLSFAAAQTKCERVDASLASITSAEENRFVTDLGILGKRPFYIGLNDIRGAREGRFRWTDGTLFRYNGPTMALRCPTNPNRRLPTPTPQSGIQYCEESELDYSNWNSNAPSDVINNGEDCVLITNNPEYPKRIGKWSDIRCSQQRYSMCKKDASEEGTRKKTSIKCPRSFETFIELGTPSKSVSWFETSYLKNSLAAHVERSNSPGDELTKGVTMVNYAFRDAYNLSATCNFSITVIEVDTTPPSIQGCPADVTLVQQPDEPIRVDWISPTTSDLSGDPTLLSQSHLPGAPFDIGVHSVNYTFADSSGNEAECLFTISVFEASNSIPQSAAQKSRDSSANELHNLITGLYVVVIVAGLSLAVLMLFVIRRNPFQSFDGSKSYSKMDDEQVLANC